MMMKPYFVCLFIALCALWSCNSDEIIQLDEQSLFSIKQESGIDFNNSLNPKVDNNILEYLYYYNGGGVAVGDLDNDGLEDIFFTGSEVADRLYINKGNLQFEDVSLEMGVSQSATWSSGVVIDDVNADGWNDIYVCKVAPVSGEAVHNELYINQEGKGFIESAKVYGLDFSGYSTQAAFIDFDHDGDLDMYLLNHSVHSVRSYGKTRKRKEKDPLSGDRLYENKLNDSEAKFVDVTEQSGIYSSALGYGLAITILDVNQDGWQDIYVGNDFHENDYIYINNQDGTFTESFEEYLHHSTKFTMGVDAADIDRDGYIDLFATDMLPYDSEVALKSGGEDTDQIFKIREDFGYEPQYARNHMLMGSDTGFDDIALVTSTYATDWSWSALIQDFDNNGREDIFISNGIVKRPNDLDYIKYLNEQGNDPTKKLDRAQLQKALDVMPSEKLYNVLFLQNERLNFSDVRDSGMGTPSFSNGSAYADLDQDGDLDLVINNINDPSSIFENLSNSSGHYISISLIDTVSNYTLKGSQVSIKYNDQTITKPYETVRGYQSSSTHDIFFGLGVVENIESIDVIWPDGSYQQLENPQIDTRITIQKQAKGVQNATIENISQDKYITSVFPATHVESPFTDYNQEKLIPERLSTEGPTAVAADFTGDGINEIFIGGARYQEPALFIGLANGEYKRADNKDFRVDAKYEDVDAAVLDFDKDGDLDLYVVSGGGDLKELDKLMEDRIYLNDGKGNLKRLPISLPHTNGSCVSIGDIDKDGFDDIFVGARSIPGSYGLSPFSFILKNKKGFGVEIAMKQRMGMVTDASWGDMDRDGDPDLVVVGDWMDIKVYENTNGTEFKDISNEIGLDQTSGLWNSVLLEDINSDGKLDILAGNIGENFKWKATADHPVELHVGDYDGNGQTEPIIFHDYFGVKKPFASLDMMSAQLPLIRKSFQSYVHYSKVQSFEDLKLNPELTVELKTLEENRSMMFVSTDSLSFEAVPLPDFAQRSPIQDMLLDPTKSEILFVGNETSYLTEFGMQMANAGASIQTEYGRPYNTLSSLGLPKDAVPRQIIKIDDTSYLVICNDGPHYLVTKKN